MPVCTHCAFPADHVYTTYASKSNVRLSVCPRCETFADPLIEHPPLLILLDLVLLKPRVYLHLLFNRDSARLDADAAVTEQAQATATATATAGRRDTHVHAQLARLALAAVAAESAVRLLPHVTARGLCADAATVARTVAAVGAETAAQLATTTLLALAVLRAQGWWPARKRFAFRDGRQENFVPALIPLTLLYSTLVPLVLQLALAIWYTPASPLEPAPSLASPFADFTASPLRALRHLSRCALDQPRVRAVLVPLSPHLAQLAEAARSIQHDVATALAEWAASDRAWAWAGTRLLGGMASGFGLRVLLPTPPVVTTALVLAGWAAAAGAGRAVEWALT
ncbi:sterol homeostasis protein [Cryptotrichosporon argae]